MVKSPCFGCELRFVGCHDNCSMYIAYRNEVDRQSELLRDDKNRRMRYQWVTTYEDVSK